MAMDIGILVTYLPIWSVKQHKLSPNVAMFQTLTL